MRPKTYIDEHQVKIFSRKNALGNFAIAQVHQRNGDLVSTFQEKILTEPRRSCGFLFQFIARRKVDWSLFAKKKLRLKGWEYPCLPLLESCFGKQRKSSEDLKSDRMHQESPCIRKASTMLQDSQCRSMSQNHQASFHRCLRPSH